MYEGDCTREMGSNGRGAVELKDEKVSGRGGPEGSILNAEAKDVCVKVVQKGSLHAKEVRWVASGYSKYHQCGFKHRVRGNEGGKRRHCRSFGKQKTQGESRREGMQNSSIVFPVARWSGGGSYGVM